MKTFLTFITVLLFGGISVYAQNGTLKLKVIGIKSTNGSIAVALYNTPETFLKEAFTYVHQDIEDNTVSVIIKDIPAGVYAVSLFHDENNNKKLDKNMVGIPNEPYGFGNNARGRFGPPGFSESSVNINANGITEMVILIQ